MKYVTIAGVTVPQTAALAPMASVADTAYRRLHMEHGACMCTGELVSAKGLCYGSKGSAELCRISQREHPMGLQLFGSEPEFIGQAVEMLLAYAPQWIDLNMGCPVPKVVGGGAGSALMRTPKLAAELVRAAVAHAKGTPVTVKMRVGWDENSINAVEFAKTVEAAGAAAICVHGRTRSQFYNGTADWSQITAVKRAVSVPVIGNGDVKSGADCLRMYEETGCDLVMVGRATYGNPWIFDEITAAVEGKAFIKPTIEQQLQEMLRHIRMMLEESDKSEALAMREVRKHALWYLRGRPGAAAFRAACCNLQSYADAEALAARYLEGLPPAEA
ncbi:MAG: tRNA dihydrouridine synthase DusB [Oscillospiraceae bacterium]|nr:tRNA dihydrouridine synthase DusB [Ruminococcus sp.]MBQ4345846.1 tRNA dihydrouridine synthase DusB [Oscillospiraceae bacterium]